MVGLWQVDGTLPNLALMKLSAWIKRQGKTSVLQLEPSENTRYASVVFTANAEKVAKGLKKYAFEVGGSGWNLSTELPDEIESLVPDYSLYGIDYAMGYLSRGCIRKCSFCLIPEKEGNLHQVSDIEHLVREDSRKLMLLDNNLTALPNVVDVLGEIAERRLKVCFTQGLDIRLMTPEIATVLNKVLYRSTRWTTKQLFFAFDDVRLEPIVRKGIGILLDVGINPHTLSFYVLVGYSSTFEEDLYRCNVLREYGIRPYVMRYKKSKQLNALARWANAPAGLWRNSFSEYLEHRNEYR